MWACDRRGISLWGLMYRWRTKRTNAAFSRLSTPADRELRDKTPRIQRPLTIRYIQYPLSDLIADAWRHPILDVRREKKTTTYPNRTHRSKKKTTSSSTSTSLNGLHNLTSSSDNPPYFHPGKSSRSFTKPTRTKPSSYGARIRHALDPYLSSCPKWV